jgi:hypothetical protein
MSRSRTVVEEFFSKMELHICDVCGWTKSYDELSDQCYPPTNIICKECYRDKKIDNILNDNLDGSLSKM